MPKTFSHHEIALRGHQVVAWLRCPGCRAYLFVATHDPTGKGDFTYHIYPTTAEHITAAARDFDVTTLNYANPPKKFGPSS